MILRCTSENSKNELESYEDSTPAKRIRKKVKEDISVSDVNDNLNNLNNLFNDAYDLIDDIEEEL